LDEKTLTTTKKISGLIILPETEKAFAALQSFPRYLAMKVEAAVPRKRGALFLLLANRTRDISPKAHMLTYSRSQMGLLVAAGQRQA